jgi:hypothetical protein
MLLPVSAYLGGVKRFDGVQGKMTSSGRSTCYRHQASTPTSPDLPLRNMTHLLVCKIASLQLPSAVAIETTVAAIEMPAGLLMYQLQSVVVPSTIDYQAPAPPIEKQKETS